jgi:predicted glycoside hydrolase/deacetylase ChbG (UPF0249 family)
MQTENTALASYRAVLARQDHGIAMVNPATMTARLIVNADDLGLSEGVNRGIVEAHVDGVLTSASLMVLRPGTADAVARVSDHPSLSVGLHADLSGERPVREQLERQLDEFRALTGREPSHLDSHHHDHRDPDLAPAFQETAAALGVPLRGDGRVAYVGGFYAQREPHVTTREYVSVAFLQRLLRDEVGDGWTEIGCHPAHVTGDFTSSYCDERGVELQTLTDPRVRATIDELGIELVSYRDFRGPVERGSSWPARSGDRSG